MNQYINTLKNTIKIKNLDNFWTLCCEDKFKILDISEKQIIKKIKKNHKLYIDKKFAKIEIIFNDTDKDNKWLFTIHVKVYPICITTLDLGDPWQIKLKYTLIELEKHPFNIMDVFHLINIVCNKILVSNDEGIFYTDFLNKLVKVHAKRVIIKNK